MALTQKQKRRWSLVILLVGLPVYVVLAVTILNALGRPPIWVEFLVYAALGLLWALPFRRVFAGVGREAPEDED
ncbi:DUF2842 domain-containing protein [Histidinibacterium aquaticum]|uniref:DUF2842 domain-containing protein n=1 Tax=Histidinibacterium aquaticum TaxID=2613962 RepID=A0A5J5GI79_9RHOB|nr:DUF2842 domain-containing protein [Histidinibacterium aquaticum]KAA9007936.1 DUF2842 domain-containing protein [Histidinibacterium aquaticum]